MAARSLEELAGIVDARIEGESRPAIAGLASLTGAGAGDLAFAAGDWAVRALRATGAGAVVVAPELLAEAPTTALVVENPRAAFARIARLFDTAPAPEPGIHATATIDPAATIAPDAAIGPHCVVEAGAVIGSGCRLGPGCLVGHRARLGAGCHLVARVTVLHEVELGARVVIHPGAVIGSDGFGLARTGDHWEKVPQLGRVVIGDDVEIGANTTIDRGALDDTVVEQGVKLDNQVHIAHNVHIGAHTVMAGCTGIAGSVRIGRDCALGGGVGVANHVTLGDAVTVTGMSLVSRSLTSPGIYSAGLPALENDRFNRNAVRFRQLDDMARRLKALEKDSEK
ncbi:MAG: UDP-3-O-(3-hydroxymyristoyl)glucosamine N-acyltransferase [Pseudomonadota bacterium]